jgi:hypothetical protein
MKTFRQLVSEVAEPKADDEKHFKAKHVTVKNDHPTAPDTAFSGGTKKAPKRRADYDKGEDEAVYENSFAVPTAAGGEHDSEESHKRYKQGNKSPKAVKEAKKMDPVGQEDDDIDNDGDTDSSDKYLHARRKAIGKAIKNEETEGLDEISRDLARRYIRKVADKTNTGELSTKQVMKRKPGIELAGKKAYPGIAGKAKVPATESVEQVDEVLKPTTDMGTWIKDFQKSDAPQFKGKSKEKRRQMAIAAKYGAEREAGMREEAEELDEISKGLADKYYRKAAQDIGTRASNAVSQRNNAYRSKQNAKGSHETTSLGTKPMTDDERAAHVKKASDSISNAKNYERKIKNRAVGMSRASARMEEVEQIDELSKKTLSSYTRKAAASMGTAAHDLGQKKAAADEVDRMTNRNMPNKWAVQDQMKKALGADHVAQSKDQNTIGKRLKGIDRATAKLAKEEAELEEKLVGGQKKLDHNKNGKIDAHDFHLMRKKKMKEEAEQLDELSPNTLHSYIKKAAGNMAGNAAVAAAQASSSMKKSSPDVKRNIKNRMVGISSASGRLADKANMAENAWEEVPMMMRQLQFIMFAAEELMDYLDTQVDPEEWFQNKLAHIHDQMQTLQAYAEGDMRMMSRMGGMYREEVELKEDITKMSHGRLKWHMNSGVPHGSYTKDEMKKERDRRLKAGEGEAYKAAKASLSEVARSAMKKSVSYTGSDGKSHTRMVPVNKVGRDEHGEEKIKESVLDEAFKMGLVKLKDGSSVTLKKEDADLLNQLMKGLNEKNRSKMEATMMADKKGFNEILSFAREAL